MRQLRLERRLSQEGLAERAGLHLTYVGGIERGERNPALDNINRLARALGVPLTEFFWVFPHPWRQNTSGNLGELLRQTEAVRDAGDRRNQKRPSRPAREGRTPRSTAHISYKVSFCKSIREEARRVCRTYF